MARTRMSSKGQIVLPKAVRDAHGFREGTEFEVIDGGKEIVLKPVETTEVRRKLTVKEFLAMRPVYDGPPITEEMIEQAILDEAARRWHEKNSR